MACTQQHITSLTPIRYRDGYIEIEYRYSEAEMAEAILSVETYGYEVTGDPCVGWGESNAIIVDHYGGYHLARIEGA